VGLLNILDQNPGRTWQELLGADVFQKNEKPMSLEEEMALGTVSASDERDDDLVSFKI
jgi:hypothetical protein